MADESTDTYESPAKSDLTVAKSMTDFRAAYQAKSKLIERQDEDFRFALGDQWSKEDKDILAKANVKPITDNRIAPNLYLLTGLERQNRTDYRAFPDGEEDSVKAEIATVLLKDTIKTSEFGYKSSDQFKDGATCGESHLELYLDHTEDIINGKPCWRKLGSNAVFPEPGFTEYDFNDSRYVYKLTLDLPREDLMNLFPDKTDLIKNATPSRIDFSTFLGGETTHTQSRDYPKAGEGSSATGSEPTVCGFDLVERYYKKWVETFFVVDREKGEVKQAESKEKADGFLDEYKNGIAANEQAYQSAVEQAQMQAAMGQPAQAPPAPPQQNPERYMMIKRMVPEIWCFAHVGGIEEHLDDSRAWFYPKWKRYPFIPYFARFSTAPLKAEDRHMLVQGIVAGVKETQVKHNKAEMLMLRHLNSSANSGWIAEEDTWVDPDKVEQFGSVPGVNLTYKKGRQRPERITPAVLSQGHAALAAESAEAIKSQLGINSDLLAAEQSGGDSGRAIALRQKQGLLMVQELFDNLTRSRVIAGRFMLSQLGEVYDTEKAKKVLGEAFLIKNFPPPPMIDERTGQQVPMPDPKTGKPMQYDEEMATVAIAEVLSGELETYDVTVGESVSSETQRMANSAEVREIAQTYPNLIPPSILIEESQLPQSTKTKILSGIQQAQALQQQLAAGGGSKTPGGKGSAG